MNTKFAIGIVAAAAALFAQGAFAQASSPTRAEVKSEAKSGGLAPAGQGPGAMSSAPKGSTKTRMERKDETKMDRKDGKLIPAGEGPGNNASSPNTSGKSAKTRAERKAQTSMDRKTGTLQPAGEAPAPVSDPMKK